MGLLDFSRAVEARGGGGDRDEAGGEGEGRRGARELLEGAGAGSNEGNADEDGGKEGGAREESDAA